MKKIILILCLLSALQLFSQEKLKFKSIEFGMGTYKISNRDSRFILNSLLDIAVSYKSNLLSLSNNTGFGFGKNESGTTDLEAFYEVDVLYGREFKLSKRIRLETHTGLGFITQNNSTDNNEKQSLGVPVKLKFLYYIGEKFAIGLNPNVSFNKVNTIYSLNLVFHINFRK